MTPPTPQRCLAAADQMLRGGATTATADGTGLARGAGPALARTGTRPNGSWRPAEPELPSRWWPRACACLIRLALEGGIDAYWRRIKPTVAACRQGRAKQLMLRGRLGPGAAVACRVAYTWAALSSAAHHHCYEAAPTAAELRRLHTEVSVLLADLDKRTEAAR